MCLALPGNPEGKLRELWSKYISLGALFPSCLSQSSLAFRKFHSESLYLAATIWLHGRTLTETGKDYMGFASSWTWEAYMDSLPDQRRTRGAKAFGS